MTTPLHSLLLRQFARTALPHDAQFEQLRRDEFSRLNAQGQVYLDYTGGGLHGATQIMRHMGQLLSGVHGNPHSVNPTSSVSTELVEEARAKVLDFFNATDDYFCIFTANATGALKLVGESYPFDGQTPFLLTADNHNSVNGIREYALQRGADFHYAPLRSDLTADEIRLDGLLRQKKAGGLFAFPAQSNVSGVRHPLSLVAKAQRLGWDVMLDAAAFVPTSRLDLKAVQPQFVSMSFYKMFGYPTGLGALLVRKDAFHTLAKRWYAGGNITLSSVGAADRFLHADHQRFEDGTVNYLDIPAITEGLQFLESIGMDRIKDRVDGLALHLYGRMSRLRHANGMPLVKFLGPTRRKSCGGTIAFNLFTPEGVPIPFQTIEDKAGAQHISLRTGCFCNPGVDEANHGIADEVLKGYFADRENGDYFDFMDHSGIQRGAVRISVGIATNRADIEAFMAFLASFQS